ncbi:hypothetical protein ABZ177_18205 [Streptomyces sp. NPDC006284]|uniref:hypothetical protein n=1 Tax=Streptomyces sp. NPDC006284 TaxID=3156742 RepID=UPI0033AC35DE
MTQSGQGEEPSARPAREGIVLPSDGGEPLLPGLAGTGAGSAGRPVPPSAPPGGQAWDRPWGPEQQQGPAQDQGWPTPAGAQPWDTGRPETAQPPAAHGWPAQDGPDRSPGALPPQAGPGPLPPEGAQPPAYGAPAAAYGGQVPGAYAYGDQAGAQVADAYGDQGYGAGSSYPQQGQGAGSPAPQQPSAPLPSADEGLTQFLPPVGIPADEGATQYIPPVGPGALPPERPAQPHARHGRPDAESTQFLGRAPQHYPAPDAAGHRPAPAAPAPHPDAEATQYIAPVPGGPAPAPYGAPGGAENRQPPAEFDNLFRSGPGADGPASSTQQMPRFDEPQPPRPGDRSGYAAPQGPGGGGGRRRGNEDGGGRGGRGGRTGSRLPLLAAVGVGIAVVGVGAGAMMAGGGEEDTGGNQTVSATAPASASASASASPSADPVRQQAVELDKLLAHSGNSRSMVINAVGDVKTCDNLSQAAKDLREAAKQRTGLVTSLSRLSVDKLPRHSELTTALTKAWQASASADNHYAAWADQTAGKNGCKKGKPRSSPGAGNRESGTASKEKAKAAKLWNAIAKEYGLTERQPTQL